MTSAKNFWHIFAIVILNLLFTLQEGSDEQAEFNEEKEYNDKKDFNRGVDSDQAKCWGQKLR